MCASAHSGKNGLHGEVVVGWRMGGPATAERVRPDAPQVSAAQITEALGGHRSGDDGWIAHCPAHDDATPSLSVSEGDGRVLVRCHAGCAQEAVIAALRERALWPGAARDEVPRRAPDHVWPYTDAVGTVVRRTARWNLPGRAKTIRPQMPDGRGGWRTGEMCGPRPLYRLPDLLGRPDAVVLIAEGEPAADAAAAMLPDHVTTTSAGGAQAAARTDWSPLHGRRVVIWPDADEAGAKYAADVARLAHDAGAASVRVVSLPPGLPATWDLADALPIGWSVDTLRKTLDLAEPADDKPEGIRVVTVAELLALDLPPREMVLAPILPVQGLAMLYAPRGTGKTYLALAIAYAIAAGAQLLRWRSPRPQRVLYLDGEMPATVMRERLARLIRGAGVEAAPDRLLIVTPDLQAGPLPDLATAAGQRAVEPLLDAADVIIVDSISTLTSAAENEADAWLPLQRWTLAQRRAGRSVVLVHHAGKGGQSRGTSRREDVLDTVLALRRPRDYRAEQGARAELAIEKGRGIHGDDARTIEVALADDGHGGLRWTYRSLDAQVTERVADLIRDGLTHRQIATELRVGIATISRHRQQAIEGGLLQGEKP